MMADSFGSDSASQHPASRGSQVGWAMGDTRLMARGFIQAGGRQILWQGWEHPTKAN